MFVTMQVLAEMMCCYKWASDSWLNLCDWNVAPLSCICLFQHSGQWPHPDWRLQIQLLPILEKPVTSFGPFAAGGCQPVPRGGQIKSQRLLSGHGNVISKCSTGVSLMICVAEDVCSGLLKEQTCWYYVHLSFTWLSWWILNSGVFPW